MNDRTNPDLILVDGSSYLFRAFHALPPLTNSNGHPTGAIKGVISMIRKLVDDYPNGQVVVVFDAKGKTFRHDISADYKANRPPMPDELRVQIEPIHKIVKALGLPLVIVPDVEADDVIGTLAIQASDAGQMVIISTGDKDMAQLVRSNIILLNTMDKKNGWLDEQGVFDKFSVRPDQIIDYLALVGDASDNIAGVPKCGPKTAAKWLSAHDNLEKIMANAGDVKGKIGENLRASLEFLPTSYQLATIKVDVALPEPLADLCDQSIENTDDLLALYEEFELRSMAAELKGSGQGEAGEDVTAAPAGDYTTILEQTEFLTWLERLKQAEYFAFDTETSGLDYMTADLVGVSFAVKAGEAAYVPVAHDYEGAPEQLDRQWVLDQLKPLLESDTPKVIGQNLKFDRSVLLNYGIELKAIRWDTMLESYVYNSTASRHDMDSLASNYLQHNTIHFEDIAGKGAKQITFNQIDLEKAGPYAAEDADITLRLHEHLWPKLQEQASLQTVFEDIEKPLVPVLSDIERYGAKIRSDLLEEQSGQLKERLEALEKQAHDLAGESFNLSSPKQLGEILYNKLELPVLKKTPKGAPSTAEPVLQELALDYELPELILEHRSLAKLKSTYTDKLPLMVNEKTGRIHTSYHQAVTATGRLSSTDPNLQNIPIRTEEGRRIRQAFVAKEGHVLVAADYSQIELRIMAHLSKDEGLLAAFRDGLDVHRATASEVFGIEPDDVSGEQRRHAKAINFGLIYGMSAFGLARQLKIGRYDAQRYMDAYFDHYPGVSHYMDDIRELAAQQGYVETLFGRRLYLPDIKSKNAIRRKAAERTAINAPMQGTAADIIKRAMVKVDDWLKSSDIQAHMIMQVHDELVFEVAQEDVEALKAEATVLMESAADLDIPLIVDVGEGANWDEAH